MSKACIGDNSASARKNKKIYFIDSAGNIRKVKKAYIGDCDNIARKCWSGGVTWAKYSCSVSSTTTYSRIPDSGGSSWTYVRDIDATAGTYVSYSFSESHGFVGSGYYTTKYTDSWGRYMVETTRISIIESTLENGDGTITVRRRALELATSNTTYSYTKGSTSYGEVSADDGELPEAGTLLRGGPSGSYCVVRVDGTTYYYTRVA